MASEKKFGLLKFDKKLTTFIKEIVSEEEIFQDLKTIESMKSFVDLSLSQLNVTKIAKDRYRADIQILIDPKQKKLTMTLLESKGFENIDYLNQKEKVNKNQKIIYTEKYHLDKKPENIKELYLELKTRILDEYLDVEAVPSKMYIAFKHTDDTTNINIMSVILRREHLIIILNNKQGTLNDYLNKTRDVSTVGHLGPGDYELKINNTIDIGYAIELFNQSYENKIGDMK